MSDLIAEAAANLGDTAPSSTEPVTIEPALAARTGNVLLNATPTVESPNVAPVADAGAPAAGDAPVDGGDAGNVLAGQTASSADLTSQAIASVSPSNSVDSTFAEPLPRESHLMLLEAKLAGFREKLVNAERVALDEFEAIVGHIRAVL